MESTAPRPYREYENQPRRARLVGRLLAVGRDEYGLK